VSVALANHEIAAEALDLLGRHSAELLVEWRVSLGTLRRPLDTDVLMAAVRSRRGASRAWIGAILRGEATLLLSVPLALR